MDKCYKTNLKPSNNTPYHTLAKEQVANAAASKGRAGKLKSKGATPTDGMGSGKRLDGLRRSWGCRRTDGSLACFPRQLGLPVPGPWTLAASEWQPFFLFSDPLPLRPCKSRTGGEQKVLFHQGLASSHMQVTWPGPTAQ